MPRDQAGVAGGITSAGRQAGQSLGVSAAGAILASGLHGTIRDGFADASQPAWLVMGTCGFAVLLLGLVSTSGARYEPRHARPRPRFKVSSTFTQRPRRTLDTPPGRPCPAIPRQKGWTTVRHYQARPGAAPADRSSTNLARRP
jgi:hypothetical protein